LGPVFDLKTKITERIMVIGDRLKELREAKELSQGDIEKRTGLLRCYIYFSTRVKRLPMCGDHKWKITTIGE